MTPLDITLCAIALFLAIAVVILTGMLLGAYQALVDCDEDLRKRDAAPIVEDRPMACRVDLYA